MNNMSKWTAEDDSFLKENYLNTEYKELVKILNKPIHAINYRLGILNLSKLKSVKDDFFSNKDLLTSYLAGNIAADGSLDDKRNRLCFNISYKDIDFLHMIKEILGFTGKVNIVEREFTSFKETQKSGGIFKSASIHISSKRILEDLGTNYNIFPRKSATLLPPTLNDFNQELAYIKGYLDGDGHILIHNNRIMFGFIGTKEVLEWIHLKLNKIEPFQIKILEQKPSPNCHTLRITGKKAYKILKFLYNIETPMLERKWSKVVKMKQIYEK